MSVDTSWIHLTNRLSDDYWHGADAFFELASGHVNEDGLVKCPCKRCWNILWRNFNVVGAHIIDYGFNPNYTVCCSSSVNVSHRQSFDKHQSDEMTKALHYLTNEVNTVDDDDNMKMPNLSMTMLQRSRSYLKTWSLGYGQGANKY